VGVSRSEGLFAGTEGVFDNEEDELMVPRASRAVGSVVQRGALGAAESSIARAFAGNFDLDDSGSEDDAIENTLALADEDDDDVGSASGGGGGGGGDDSDGNNSLEDEEDEEDKDDE
jgi:hypothetical protein